jgi:uncharacterized membrane protein
VRVSQIEKHERQRRKKWCVNFQSFLASKAFVLSVLAAAALVRDKKSSPPRLVARKAAQLFEISIAHTKINETKIDLKRQTSISR